MASLGEEKVSTHIGKIQVWRGGRDGARPVVYLHSATGEGPGLPVLEDLADTHAVIAPMFPGFGESEGIEQIDDVEDAVFHLLDVFDALGLGAAPAPAIVGLSLGGWLAAEVATRYPERVSALVLVNPAGLYVKGHEIGEIFNRPPADLAQVLFADQSHPLAQALHAAQSMMDSHQQVPFELIRPQLQTMAATAKIGWRPYLHNPKLARRLYRVTAPTLIVHGKQDGLIPREHAEAYAAGIAGARLVDVDGAAHLLPLEKPAELAALIREHVVAEQRAG
jgi:pimeloyl-ACP methyl ester carboxylesterase